MTRQDRTCMTDVDPDHASLAEVSKPSARKLAAPVSRSPYFNLTLGAEITAARVKAGMSQIDLSQALGVTFEQVQKYENGARRVAADTLQMIGEVLRVHPGSFFDNHVPVPSEAVLEAREGIRAAVAVQQIRDPETRRQLLALAEELARAETGRSSPSPASSGPPAA